MKKEELRQLYRIPYGSESPIGDPYYFHRWIIKKDSKGNEKALALIEDKNGIIFRIDYDEIKFIN